MQLSEIKNDLATINYSPEINKLMLGDFILVEDTNQSILAQIVSIEATLEEDVNSAMLKFLLSIDKDANLTQYSGYVPAKNASLILINPEEVVQLIKSSDKNIKIGNLAAYPDIPVELNLDFLRKKTYIQVDFVENRLQIVKTIIKGLEKHNRKTLLFDFQGLYESLSLPTVTIGYNFKLPLNYDALCYIAEEEINDFDNKNRAIIQGILIEVQNYVKTTKDEFIPFDTFISVLDAQYDESPMPELLLLKNKLLKYQQQGLFAQDKAEFDFLDSFLKDAKNFKFDLSEVPSQWHKIAISSILNIIKAKCYLIADFNDDNSNKTIIKRLYEKNEIKPIILSSYNYKYQLQLKAMSKNLILFKPVQKVNDFAGYTSFLNILSQDTFIVWGEQTLYIPLILKLNSDIDQKIDTMSYKKISGQQVSENPDNLPENISMTDEVKEIESVENIETLNENDIINESQNNINEYNEEIANNDNILENDIIEEDNIEDKTENITKIDDINEVNIEDYNIPEQPVEENITENNESLNDNVIVQQIELVDDIPNSNDMDFFFDEKENMIDEVESNIDTLMQAEQDDELIQSQKQDDGDELTSEEINDNDNDNELPAFDYNLLNDDNENTLPDIDSELLPNNDDEKVIEDFSDANIDENLVDNTKETDEPEVIDFSDNITQEETELIEKTNDEENQTDYDNDKSETTLNNITEEIETNEDTITTESEIDSQVTDNQQNINTNEEVKPVTVELKKDTIPVYTSNVAPQFDTKFAQGTYVHHPKYGRGVVEKVINYGTKELCLIIFDSEGRKLLDPNIAELKQI